MKNTTKRHRGDTRTAYLVRDLDAMHRIMPFALGDRIENEAVAKFEIPVKAIDEYLARKNAEKPEDQPKYTYLHVIAAATARVVEQRPLMNRFIRRQRYYDRKDISISFTAKKQKVDGAEEALIVAKYDPDSEKKSIDIMHDKICLQVKELRHENKASSTDQLMETLKKLPFWLLKIVAKVLVSLDRRDLLPSDITNSLPYSSTCFISNLGSIKLNADYHHLANFGSNSCFMIIGEKYNRAVFNDDGSYTVEKVIPISMTLDERIADGVYFGNSMKMLKALLMNPEILDRSANDKVDLKQLTKDLF